MPTSDPRDAQATVRKELTKKNPSAGFIAMLKSIAVDGPVPIPGIEVGLVPLEDLEMPTHHAGVAQSAEQVFRKDEAAGSTPVSSSKGLNEEQHELVAKIVHHRVAIEDYRKASIEVKKLLAASESEYKKAKEAAERSATNIAENSRYHTEQLLLAEENLRQSILGDVLIKGAPAPEPTPEIDHDDQIGRAE